ncbi:MAG: hypothetical protein HC887_01750 [Desulfobacteraceae bacterium]|nr:hypothetical protein [Desulfobacteraceae bacterium]
MGYIVGFKKKILIFSISALVIAGAAAFLFIRYPDRFRKEPIFIAVTGPMSGKHGEEMLKGIQLYLRHAKQSEEKHVELIIRDDKTMLPKQPKSLPKSLRIKECLR